MNINIKPVKILSMKKYLPLPSLLKRTLILSVIVIIVSILTSPDSHAATTNQSEIHYRQQAEAWCRNYLRNNPRKTCTVVPNINAVGNHPLCTGGLQRGASFSAAGTGNFIVQGFSALTALSGSTTCIPATSVAEYVLQCRGGGNMTASIDRAPLNSAIKIYGIKKSRYAAKIRRPGSGECAWIDRPLSSREPSRLLYNIKGRKTIFSRVTIGSNGINLLWGNDPVIAILKHLPKGQLFSVRVKNNHHGWLEIVKVEPNPIVERLHIDRNRNIHIQPLLPGR